MYNGRTGLATFANCVSPASASRNKSHLTNCINERSFLLFSFILLYERDRRGSIDSRRKRKDEIQGHAYSLVGVISYHVRPSLSMESAHG